MCNKRCNNISLSKVYLWDCSFTVNWFRSYPFEIVAFSRLLYYRSCFVTGVAASWNSREFILLAEHVPTPPKVYLRSSLPQLLNFLEHRATIQSNYSRASSLSLYARNSCQEMKDRMPRTWLKFALVEFVIQNSVPTDCKARDSSITLVRYSFN